MMLRTVTLLLASATATATEPGDWAVIGAGNATCAQWSAGNTNEQTEILSWMAGFASAMNLTRAAQEEPEYRLEYLTYDYLRSQIKARCSASKDKDQRMSGVLFDVLRALPEQVK